MLLYREVRRLACDLPASLDHQAAVIKSASLPDYHAGGMRDILPRLQAQASSRCWPGRSILNGRRLRVVGQSTSGSATKPLLVPCKRLRVTWLSNDCRRGRLRL